MILQDRIANDLLEWHRKLDEEGELASRAQLDQCYATFRSKFGPDVLAGLDGETLLEKMHGRGANDSLMYWLEFKNDEEFPNIFGSIAGGSSLKFGLYARADTGAWMTGAASQQREISISEAVESTRKQRDQLLRGCEILDRLPALSGDDLYRRLQEDLYREAPEVSKSAWGHKYFSLLFPEKLDNFHTEEPQRFHLLKLLQLPPEGGGRYQCAGRYIAIAHELGWPILHLARIINARNGRPYHYWKVLVSFPGASEFTGNWELMTQGGFVGIGWRGLGDLTDFVTSSDLKDIISERSEELRNNRGGWAEEVANFIGKVQEGDLILACERSTVLGIGRVTGPYQYDPSTPVIPHHHPVEWLSVTSWKPPQLEAQGRSIKRLQNLQNIREIESQLQAAAPVLPDKLTPLHVTPQLQGIAGKIQGVLDRKKQVILYGPPGTGKTYWARCTAQDLAAYGTSGIEFAKLSGEQQSELLNGSGTGPAQVRICTFHPAYGYEDFLEGYRPVTDDGRLGFVARDGIFKRLCQDAAGHPEQKFFLIIDEINRGDIPRIFGELLTILEADKRNLPIVLPLSGARFTVPPNVYLIGTMNTADRSIALLDTALRRRFGFIELMPDSSLLGSTMVGGIPLAPWMDALNERMIANIGRDARNLQIGHAYLLEQGAPVTDFSRFAKIIEYDLLPLLEEYCYEDYPALAKILGTSLVDIQRQRIRHELFDPGRQDDLVQALLEPCPEILASPKAEVVEPEMPEVEEEESGEPGTEAEAI